MVVTVAYNDTGNVLDTNYTVPGQSLKIYSGILSRKNVSDTSPFDYRLFSVVNYTAPGGQSPNPTVCDARIGSVTINKKETSIGSVDGQATINATSSYGPIQYKLDSGSFQSSPIFTGLTGGLHTAYITDANGCTASLAFTMPTLFNLLVADPSADLGNGNISRWSAAFNPIVFTYQRKDFEVIQITQDTATQKPVIMVNGNISAISSTDKVYLNAGPYKGIYNIVGFTTNWLIIDAAYVTPSSQTGFININSLRPYYKVYTQITYQDILTGQQQGITATNRPDSTGLIKADFSNFLQSLLQIKDNSDYTQANFRDLNLGASYQLQYAESWDNPDGSNYISDYVTVTDPFYVLYAARQLGQKYGGNMAAYVPFAPATGSAPLAAWITDFAEPAFSTGYPFDIGFIYSEYLLGLNIYCEIVPLDINRSPLSGDAVITDLLNEDGSWLLNQDGSKFIISGETISGATLPAQLGLNRLLINTTFPTGTYYFNITLKYNDESDVAHAITQTQTIRIDDAVDENSIYLRWIGLTGSWNYYRFVYNQEISLDVQNATIIKNYVSDWENQQGIEEVIAKDAGQKMKVMAEDLSVNDIKGLQSIKYSPKVQMLVNKNPVKWQTVVINTATYSEYETLNGQAPFSITFNTPSINIQTQ
ncbi:MAG TPA: hypothetical protein VHE59_18235 [Mucilaginibacter sp.]|nr:hypothetical protein [Mucilaginibacter sp.]